MLSLRTVHAHGRSYRQAVVTSENFNLVLFSSWMKHTMSRGHGMSKSLLEASLVHRHGSKERS